MSNNYGYGQQPQYQPNVHPVQQGYSQQLVYQQPMYQQPVYQPTQQDIAMQQRQILQQRQQALQQQRMQQPQGYGQQPYGQPMQQPYQPQPQGFQPAPTYGMQQAPQQHKASTYSSRYSVDNDAYVTDVAPKQQEEQVLPEETIEKETIKLIPYPGHEHKFITDDSVETVIDTDDRHFKYSFKVSNMKNPPRIQTNKVTIPVVTDVIEGNKKFHLSSVVRKLKLESYETSNAITYAKTLALRDIITSKEIDDNVYVDLVRSTYRKQDLESLSKRLGRLIEEEEIKKDGMFRSDDIDDKHISILTNHELKHNLYCRIDEFLTDKFNYYIVAATGLKLNIDSYMEDFDILINNYIPKTYPLRSEDLILACNKFHDILMLDIENEVPKVEENTKVAKTIRLPENVIIAYSKSKIINYKLETMEDNSMAVNEVSHTAMYRALLDVVGGRDVTQPLQYMVLCTDTDTCYAYYNPDSDKFVIVKL